MKGRLFLKIFATYLAIAVLAVGIVGFLAGNRIEARLEQQIENELMAYAGIADLYPMKEIQTRAEEIARIARARVTILDREGGVIADTDPASAAVGTSGSVASRLG